MILADYGIPEDELIGLCFQNKHIMRAKKRLLLYTALSKRVSLDPEKSLYSRVALFLSDLELLEDPEFHRQYSEQTDYINVEQVPIALLTLRPETGY